MRHLERKAIPTGPAGTPGSLAAALASVPDPRRPYGWDPAYPPVPLVGLLQLAVVAMLCGARSLSAIAQWAAERQQDEPALLGALGVPPERRPCVATLHRVFKALDVGAYEAALGGWLAEFPGPRREGIAFDGKALRGSQAAGVPGVYLVAAYAHQRQAVLRQLRIASKGQEIAAARTLIPQVVRPGHVVTADALLTQRAVCREIVAAGGDYLLPVDDNQPTLRADVADAFPPLGADTAG
jgi:hypothetical protein